MSAPAIPDVATIAEQAFVLAYPAVVMSRAPAGGLAYARDTPDTLRTWGRLDLTDEPVIVSVPNTFGRYYVLWLRDAWNTVFASLGARTTGTAQGAFALLGPGCRDARLPSGVTPIATPTRTVHITGCIEAIGEPDAEAFQRVQDGFALVPLSRWGRERAPAGAPRAARGDPAELVEQMDASEYFAEVARLAAIDPPGDRLRVALERLRAARGPSLERGLQRGRAAVHAAAERPLGGGWRLGQGPLGRGPDPPVDVIHFHRGPLSGEARYVLRFAPDAAPPVHGFWSLTVSGDAGWIAQATGDRCGLALDPDGSLPIYVQTRRRRSNWLPAPPDAFSLALRLYWPGEPALRHAWSPPALTSTG